jgi:cadmium resistance protein CadD (predicted permease)
MPDLAAPVASEALLVSILTTAVLAAFLHAALPTHWLPFVLVGRGQGWTTARTLRATALAGLIHVGVTILAGVIVVWAGMSLNARFQGLLPILSSATLIGLGIWYLATRKGGAAPDRAKRFLDDRAALVGLVLALAVYPSEAYLPVFLSGAAFGWSLFFLLSAILLVATLAGMALFVSLAFAGAGKLRLERWERHERTILAVVLIGLGVGSPLMHAV